MIQVLIYHIIVQPIPGGPLTVFFQKTSRQRKKIGSDSPIRKRVSKKSQNLSILGTLRNWITGAEGPTFSLLLVHVAVSSALAPRHDLKKQKGQAKNWATHVCDLKMVTPNYSISNKW